MKRRYVYLNILFTITALLLPCPYLKFGKYTEGKFTSVPGNGSVVPKFDYLVPSFNELTHYLKEFSRNYSYFATLYELGKTKNDSTTEGFPIYNLVLSSVYAKPIIVIIGGIYASDLSSPQALIQCFTEWTANTKVLAQLLPLYDYHFIPLLNPEGYQSVYQKKKKGESFTWLKNMRRFRKAKSVNILNNFDNHFKDFPRTMADEHYGGETPFSEPESLIIRDYILEIKNKVAAVFLIFSSPKDDVITYPYAHTLEKHDSWIMQEQLASHAIRTAGNISYISIAVASAAEYGGLEGGRMDDWLMDTLRTSIVLNIQLSYSLKDSDNVESLKNLDTNLRTLLKRLIVGSYRDKYSRYQARSEGLHEELYSFSWKKVV